MGSGEETEGAVAPKCRGNKNPRDVGSTRGVRGASSCLVLIEASGGHEQELPGCRASQFGDGARAERAPPTLQRA
eukprot:5192378-Pyramimonas_sp.AAC.1